MYGTIARLHPRDGALDELRELQAEWNRDRRPQARGARDGYLFVPDRNPYDRPTVFLVAIFDDQSSYRDNADDPAQDAWYRRMRAQLTDDPDWMDGRFEPS